MMKRYLVLLVVLLSLIAGISIGAPITDVNLDGLWKFHTDMDNSGLQKLWQSAAYDAKTWQTITVPGEWEKQDVTQPNPSWTDDSSNMPYSGYAWYRRSVTIPLEWKNQRIFFNSGNIDDKDWVFINGALIGESTSDGKMGLPRQYEVPSGILVPGKPAVIAIRVLDTQGLGGIVSGPVYLSINAVEPAPPVAATAPVPAPVTPTPGAVIQNDNDLVKVGEDIVVEAGEAVRNVIAVRGDVIIKGHVTESAIAVLGDVHVLPGGVIDGDAVSVMGSVNKESGATISGKETSVGINGAVDSGKDIPKHIKKVGSRAVFPFIGFLLLSLFVAILLTVLFPQRITMVSNIIQEKPGLSALYGIAGGLLIIPIALLLFITCIGIPIIVIEILLVALIWIAGKVTVDLVIGKRISIALNRPITSLVVAVILGEIVLHIISLVPVLGAVLVFAITVVGFGAVIMTGFGNDERWFINRFSKKNQPAIIDMPDTESPSADNEPQA